MSALELLVARAEEASRQAERLNRMVELARELGEDGLSELVTLLGPADGTPNGNGNNAHAASGKDAPRGREAVRIIVRERPGVWTYKDLRAEMQRRGWFTTDSGLEAAAKRLCDSNSEGRRIGKGRYVFPANHGEEVAREEDAHGASGAFVIGE